MSKQKPLRDILDDAVNRVKSTTEVLPTLQLDEDGSVTNEDIVDLDFPQDIEEFMLLMSKIEDVILSARKIKEQMTIQLGDRYSGQAIKNAGKVIVGRPSTSYKPYDKDRVLDYLGEDWRSVVRPEFRVTGVKAVAEKRGDDPNLIMESLFEKVITNNNVTILPESKAPKYLQELNEGEVKELGK
jgi:hypothetical protein